tara:strand:+ start:550 stop:735 length:186 start_codon:yes stop_codon:yes gene_type:complete
MKNTELKKLVKHLNDYVQGNEDRLEEVLQKADEAWTSEQKTKEKGKQVLQNLWASQKRKRK